MRRGRRLLVCLTAALALSAAVPAAAWAHAALLRTTPAASGVASGPPAAVALTYSEAIEPRFAVISVTDAAGRQQTTGPPTRPNGSADTIEAPLKRLPEGWYLVYWRVISADGHPVRGAWTFAVGPNPGPAPQFVIPQLSETATTPGLLTARWVVFLALLSAIGLLAFRLVIARPAARLPGVRLRAVSWAFWGALLVTIVAVPTYVEIATAQFAVRSPLDLAGNLPLLDASPFGRAFLALELVLVLVAGAAAAALRVDRPSRTLRSVAELLALTGVGAALAAAALVPGLAGHAAETSPALLSLAVDWLHVVAAGIWVGGLVGLALLTLAQPSGLRIGALAVVAPRFSRVALVAVAVVIASGTISAISHLPTLGSLWQTSYGEALLAKVALVALALLLAAGNLLRTAPRLGRADSDPAMADGAAKALRALVGGEIALLVAAIFAAAILSSVAPPPQALGAMGSAQARVGPGRVATTLTHGGYRIGLGIAPNQAAVPNTFSVALSRGGAPVRGADVTVRFTMLDMDMAQQQYRLAETAPGAYRRTTAALVMVGHWGLDYTIAVPGQAPFDLLVVDHATG